MPHRIEEPYDDEKEKAVKLNVLDRIEEKYDSVGIVIAPASSCCCCCCKVK